MVYCRRCGAENEDDTNYCVQCGVPLREDVAPSYYYRRRDEKAEKHEKGEKDEKLEKGEKHEKTETEGRNWLALIGLLIIVTGVISLLDSLYWWVDWDRLWPIPVIILGLFIIWNGIQARKRSPRP